MANTRPLDLYQIGSNRGTVLVVANPAARRDTRKIIRLLESLAPPGITLEKRVSSHPGHATDLVKEMTSKVNLVVAIGGDGTVSEVASALCGTSVPLGIVPAGSTNIVARELGIPTNSKAAIRLLFESMNTTTIDVAAYGERCFLHMAGSGLDSRMFAATNPKLKRKIGWIAYVPAAINNILSDPADFFIETENHKLHVCSSLILVANGSSIIAPSLKLYPDIRKDDGLLDIIIFTPKGRWQIARTVVRLFTKTLDRCPFVTRIRVPQVSIYSDPPMPFQLDGDVAGTTPCTLTIMPKAIRIITP